MTVRRLTRAAVVGAVLAVIAALTGTSLAATGAATKRTGSGRYVVVARSAADYRALRAKAVAQGARVLSDLPQINMLVVNATDGVRGSLAADPGAAGVAADHIEKIAPADTQAVRNLAAPGLRSARRVSAGTAAAAPAAAGISPDPAFNFRGLQWDYRHIGLPQGWKTTAGSPDVTVGVADTGLDFTHMELASKVKQVVDLTTTEITPICKTFFGASDDDLAAQFGGPATTDWNGHGSWIGGNIAGALNRTGINGIAPKVGLVSLKISQWCGSAYDSTIIGAFLIAANMHLDVVSISFGGYLDRTDTAQDLLYQQYVAAVKFARTQGTVIVAAAGNEHTRVGPGGQVLTHGTLTTPGAAVNDVFGQFEVPGGVPGVVDVASTGRKVNGSSDACAPGTIGDPTNTAATCKPASDAHQPSGVGMTDQLAYYSNYGPRIDIAAPGGARKFNLPASDRGGTPGFPVTADDLTNVWEDFSTTSNWAVQIPCFTFAAGSGFPAGQCYTAIQGTSMATPHVSAVLALLASAHPSMRHHVGQLVSTLKSQAVARHNTTPALSATDMSAGDLTAVACATGYCHLGGDAIPDAEAYGAGLLNAAML